MSNFKLTPAQDKAMDVLVSDATFIALGGGSRSGKTFLLMRAVLIRALREPNSRHVVFRFRFNSVKASVILDTLPKVMKLCFPELPSSGELMNKTDWYMTLPNGSEIWFAGLDDKDRTEKILGMEFATIYYNECSQIPWQSVILSLTRLAQKTKLLRLKCYFDFNPPSKMHWSYLQFIEKKNPEDKVPYTDPHRYGFYLINPYDNKENIAPEYLAILEAMPEKARNRFLLGRFADDSEGALWTVELLAQNRVMGQQGSLPDFLRVVVAVDPSGCDGSPDTRSDEVGIVVCALGVDGHGYLLEDLSGKYKPEDWGRITCDAYHRHCADGVVGEQNFGGDMVRSTIQTQDVNIPYKPVTASRGKVVRASPISALYGMGKIHHVGHFAQIEDQMCSTLQSGYIGLKSPDRMDAVVWGFTELFPGIVRGDEKTWVAPQAITRDRSASRYSGRRI